MLTRLSALLFIICASCTALHPEKVALKKEARALWVTRAEYQTADDVKKIVANAASLHLNVILFQVRGNGTVFYKSKIEPWAFELTSKDPKDTGKDPGWDPLQSAIEAAHSHGIELHAWVNVFPAWQSQSYPPKDSGQLWWTHPDWFMHDAAGEKMLPRDHKVNPKVADWYAFLSPGVPEVQDYLAGVCEEIVRNYDVDGLHFDYIRYPREIDEVKKEARARSKKLGNWSYDPTSLARFTAETGVKTPDDDPEKWIQWRADQVTATVRKIVERARPARPKLIVSAAVGPDPTDAKRGKFQSYIEWLDKGYLDAVFLMGYTDKLEKFELQAKNAFSQKPAKGYMSAGVGTKYEPAIIAEEISISRKLGMNGFAGFSYLGLFNQHHPRPVADQLKAGPLAEPALPPWR